MSLSVFGASDDLVEVEGDIRDEFNPHADDEPSYLAVSDGTLLRISYDGQWHISRIVEGNAAYKHEAATAEDGDREDGTPAYSDLVTLTAPDGQALSWVLFGHQKAGA